MPILILFGALVVAAAGYVAYWLYLAGAVDQAAVDQITDWRANDIQVAYADLAVGGFPFRLTVKAQQPMVDASATERFRWQTGLIDIVAQPWDLRHWIAVVDTPSRLTVIQAPDRPDIDIEAETMRASLVVDGAGRPARATGDLRQIRLRSAALLDVVTADRGQIHFRRHAAPDDPRLQVAIQLTAILLPEPPSELVGRRIEDAFFDATVTGPPPAAFSPGALAQWRDAGGTIDIAEMRLAWSSIQLAASGTVALDDLFRPIGALTTELRGAGALIDTFAATGQLTADAAAAARLVVALVSKPHPDGGQVVELPLSLQDGEAYLGPILIGTFGPVIERR